MYKDGEEILQENDKVWITINIEKEENLPGKKHH